MKNLKSALSYISLLILFSTSVNAQLTGILTRNPKASSLLEMNVSSLPSNGKKGFLLPRVALASNNDVTTVNSPLTGLWVYNTFTKTGTNAINANNIYLWNGTLWDAYSSTSEILSRISPPDYYVKSAVDNLMSTLELISFNAGLYVPVSWETASVLIANPDYVVLNGDLQTFDVKKDGWYDISGFINYNPKINSTSSKTALSFILQLSTNGGLTWTNLTTVNSTFEESATNTVQTITIPFDVIKLQVNNKFRFVMTKPTFVLTNVNHGSTAGITSAAGDWKKSFRISFMVGL